MIKVSVGIDNGVSGSIGIIFGDGLYQFHHTPVFKTLSYTKKVQHINRIDVVKLRDILYKACNGAVAVHVMLERPLVNAAMFKSTQSAMRSLEATLIVMEGLGLSYEYLDSKAWQKELLPSGLKGSPELKAASLDVGSRLFPRMKDKFKKDADGMLIAEFCRLKYK